MVKISLDYMVPDGEFCETRSVKGTNGERTGKITPSCIHVVRSFDSNPANQKPVIIRCAVFNKLIYHRPGVGVFKCQEFQDRSGI